MNNDNDTTVVAERPKSHKGLWMLLGLLLGLILGALLGGAVGSLFGDKITDDSTMTSQSNTTNGSESRSSTTLDDRLTGTEGMSSRYASLLAETTRESVDIPSAEATASQTALSKATSEFARTIVEQSKTKNSTNQADLENKLGAVNTAFIKYTAAAGNTTPSETEVVAAVSDLQTYLSQNYEMSTDANFKGLIMSFQNSMLEGDRNFVAQDFEAAYTKHQLAQQDFVKAFALITNK